MKSIPSCIIPALVIGLLGLAGCQSPNSARYIESQGTETIVSLDQINIQDWGVAADEMVNSLLTSGVLERGQRQPAVMAISRIVNNTQQQLDTDYLIRKIRVALNQSGKVLTTTTIGLGGRAEDPLARDIAAMAQAAGEEPAAAVIPDFTLSGKLLENRAQAGSVRQVTYTFQLALTETRTGLALWEEEKEITKQGRRPAVGW
jgi:hypothetical protein